MVLASGSDSEAHALPRLRYAAAFEALSTYARQFLDQMERPDVDSIEGLSPSISIDQKTTGRSPRSTVGTITEIYDYLRLLYSSIGIPHCPVCGNEISRQTTEQILQHVLSLKPDDRIHGHGADRARTQGRVQERAGKLARQGFVRARIDGVLRSLDEDIASTSAAITRSKSSSTGCW